jgi:predicted transcriptional regulator
MYEELRKLTLIYMAKHGLSQVKMAELLGTQQPMLNNFLNPKKNGRMCIELMEQLVAKLREDGLMEQSLMTYKAIQDVEEICANSAPKVLDGHKPARRVAEAFVGDMTV